MIRSVLRRFGNQLYEVAFPVYRPLYGMYKALEDRSERRLLCKWLGPGDVVADIGANVGVYSQFFEHLVRPGGRVHSFEPSLDNFARLRAGLGIGKGIVLNQMAVGDTTGEVELYISDELNVDHRTYPVEGSQRRTVTIQSTRLDDYFTPGSRVDFLKLDVQGYEMRVLRGAERVLTDNLRVRLLLEIWPYGLTQAGDSVEQLFDFLGQRDFSIFRSHGGELVPFEAKMIGGNIPDNYTNVFAFRGEAS